jgi:hypothetical protein
MQRSSQAKNSHNSAAATKKDLVTAVQISENASAAYSKKEAQLGTHLSCLLV